MNRPFYKWVWVIEARSFLWVKKNVVPEAMAVGYIAAVCDQRRILIRLTLASIPGCAVGRGAEAGPHSFKLLSKGKGSCVAAVRMVSCQLSQTFRQTASSKTGRITMRSSPTENVGILGDTSKQYTNEKQGGRVGHEAKAGRAMDE